MHALAIADPGWSHPTFRAGPPVNWPGTFDWHEDFPCDADIDAYGEVHPYGDDEDDQGY